MKSVSYWLIYGCFNLILNLCLVTVFHFGAKVPLFHCANLYIGVGMLMFCLVKALSASERAGQ